LEIIHDPSIDRITPYIFAFRTTFEASGYTFLRDANLALITETFVPKIIDGTEEEDHTLTLSPNPATNTVTVYNYHQIATLIVSNMIGQEMLIPRNQLSNEFNVSSLAPGIYLVKITSPEGRLLKMSRLIKK
jgi:hypothetical protein